MIRIVICDDEEKARQMLKQQLAGWPGWGEIPIELHVCGDARQLLEIAELHQPDLILLDIEMEGMNGLRAAEQLGPAAQGAKLLFVTNLEHLVFEALQHHPYGFVRKSRLAEDLQRYLGDFLEGYCWEHKAFTFEGKSGKFQVFLKKISYIESYGHQVLLHQTDGKVWELKGRATSLEALERKLGGQGFIRCHKSYLVNCREIYFVGNDELRLREGKVLPVSHRRICQVRKVVLEWKRK